MCSSDATPEGLLQQTYSGDFFCVLGDNHGRILIFRYRVHYISRKNFFQGKLFENFGCAFVHLDKVHAFERIFFGDIFTSRVSRRDFV